MPAKTKEPKRTEGKVPRKSSAKAKDKSQAEELNTDRQQKQQAKTTEKRETMSDQSDVVKKFAKTTSHVVLKAASILEEEIAAGIVAAKQVEKRFLSLNGLHSGEPDGVIQRFRKDAHEIVDIFLDLLSVATKYIGGLAQDGITIRGVEPQKKSGDIAAGQLPTLKATQSIKAGKSAEVAIVLENDSDNSTEEFNFYSTDLVNTSGDRISADRITFAPPLLTIGPHKTERAAIILSIPKGTPSGIYSGLIQATKRDQLRAVLVVQVD